MVMAQLNAQYLVPEACVALMMERLWHAVSFLVGHCLRLCLLPVILALGEGEAHQQRYNIANEGGA